MIRTLKKMITEYTLTWICGLFVVGMFVAFLVKQDVTFSEVENRYLMLRPKMGFDVVSAGTFMDDFDTYSEEQLPLRDYFIKVKAVCEMFFLKCENNGIARGKDGYLFEKVVRTDSKCYKNMAAIEEFVKSQDRKVYVAIAPTSTAIYGGRLPIGMPVLNEDGLSEELASRLGEYENVAVIDLMDAERSHSSEDIYYRTDHHWTSLGAYYAYECIAESLGIDRIDIDKLAPKEANDFYGTYYAKYKGLGIKGDSIDYYDIPISQMTFDDTIYDGLYDEEKLLTYDKYGMFLHGNAGIEHIETLCGNGMSLVIFKDSYANCLVPYLTSAYENIYVVDLRYYAGSVSELLEDNSDADVILLYNWSFVNEDNHFYKLVS